MSDASSRTRLQLRFRGEVQGVGFRPYVYRVAGLHGIGGFVANDRNGAVVEAEGTPEQLADFERDLLAQLPPLARVTELKRATLPPRDEAHFVIAHSDLGPQRPGEVTPDAATCADCRRELFDRRNRRYRYPFTNCTNCGPRYTIIRDMPYDRLRTTMAAFKLCPACRAEYKDPTNRRFHAQPNACPVCGPQVRLVDAAGAPLPLPADVDAVQATAARLQRGEIVAVKGLGGYHLACRADLSETVQRLRQRKLRDGKPLALMVADVAAAERLCEVTPADVVALTSPAAPIVLMPMRADADVAPEVAPGCRDLGVMLPYTPLHLLLFAAGLGPLVLTSANIAGQPLTYRDEDALRELADVADAFLMHNRPIARPIDDSVVFTFRGDVIPVRRARGYAPRGLAIAASARPVWHGRGPSILATGGDLKATVCLWRDGTAVVSEHLGDLAHPAAWRHYQDAAARLQRLLQFSPDLVACDRHPRYFSRSYAQSLRTPHVDVQHHHAHIAALLAEWGTPGPVLGIACDGTGFGDDGTIWGGELLVCERAACERVGHLANFPLVGGDSAALETWRPAAALCYQAFGADWLEQVPAANDTCNWPTAPTSGVFMQQLARELNVVATSSLGRVFDAVSFLLGLCPRNRHEAEAAMTLEAAAAPHTATAEPLEYQWREQGGRWQLDLVPTIRALLAERDAAVPAGVLAARFHITIVAAFAVAARVLCTRRHLDTVALGGGCFANRVLLDRLTTELEGMGLRVLYPRHMPPGDGAVALGQAFVVAHRVRR